MAYYSIISHRPIGEAESACRRRADAARYWAHKYVYDHFEEQGIRDRPAAHEALRRVYDFDPRQVKPDPHTGQRLYRIPCGYQREVVINCGRAAK